MEKIVECVPNFSEGRDKNIIDAISQSIESVEDVVLLDVDPGDATNRTVVTFIGSPEGVKDAAFLAVKTASELIDMRHHSGAHARMGATDVCPFVPVRGVSMDDCVTIAKEVGERIARELRIPVYLYEDAATRPERKNLATVRQGEYEGLEEKLKDPEWVPDFGEVEFNSKSGAIAVGAREFLIAYNVNLNTTDRKIAHDIALGIREKGRAKRDKEGKIIRDEDGKIVKVLGLLKECKAVGWVIDEYQKAQVSINLTNYHVTPPHVVFETIREAARKRGLRVTGSEIVGLIPLEAMLMAGRYYLNKQGKTTGVTEKELVRIAVDSLGLNDVSEFDPNEKIVENRVMEGNSLASMSLNNFIDEVSTDSPAPGGGSVAAMIGSLGSALISMVASLTHSKKGMETYKSEMEEIGVKSQELKNRLATLVDEDTRAFDAVMSVFRMKKKTGEEKLVRNKAIQEATKNATQVPLEVCELCLETLELAKVVATRGNPNSVSDAGVAAEASLAGLRGAALNVLINLQGIEDKSFCDKMTHHVKDLKSSATELRDEMAEIVEKVIKSL
ncbi:MAG: glutamate formimidoyltransferase [Candidatus Marinimicrobia bacterium]|nr:glutamate formimidoyltransferase [Candidatus Neomarinimicrobiota bacterium]